MKRIYRNGYPSKRSVEALKTEFEVSKIGGCYSLFGLNISGNYNYSGVLSWNRTAINQHIPEFIEFLKTKGIEVETFNLYDNSQALNGQLKFKKIQ